jgi:hypothetical protein
MRLIQVGPTVEWSYPDSLTKALERDDELNRLLPFLALPDGAHLVSIIVMFRMRDRTPDEVLLPTE